MWTAEWKTLSASDGAAIPAAISHKLPRANPGAPYDSVSNRPAASARLDLPPAIDPSPRTPLFFAEGRSLCRRHHASASVVGQFKSRPCGRRRSACGWAARLFSTGRCGSIISISLGPWPQPTERQRTSKQLRDAVLAELNAYWADRLAMLPSEGTAALAAVAVSLLCVIPGGSGKGVAVGCGQAQRRPTICHRVLVGLRCA